MNALFEEPPMPPLPEIPEFQPEKSLLEQQKELQRRLKESIERYELLYENLAEGFLIINNEGVITACNKAATEIFGYSPEEIKGTTIQAYLHPDARNRAKEALNQAVRMKSTSAEGWIFRGLHKDGSSIIFQIKNAPIIKEGKVIGFQSIIRDITLEKLMEKALRASEEKYRSIVEQSLQGFAILQDQKLIFVNRAIEKILGYTNEELVTLPFKELQAVIHPEDREKVWTRFKDRLEGKPVKPKYDARAICKNGEIRWIEIFSNRLQYQGRPAIQVLIIDITNRKKAEAALRASEKKYRALIEQSIEGILITKGVPPRIVFANPAVSKILGYSLEELVKYPPEKVVSLISPDDRDSILSRLQLVLDGDNPSPREMRVQHKDKSYRLLHILGQKIEYEGEPALQLAFIDITDSKLTQIALQESEEQYRALVEIIPDAVTLTDLEGKIIIANQQSLRLHGVESEEDLIGKNAFNLISHEERERAYDNLEKTLKTGKIERVEYTLLRKDGSRFPGELSASMIRDANGNPRALIGVTRDLSEPKEVEARYRSLFNSVPVGIFRTTPDGRILDANPALIEMLGYDKKDELLKRKASDFYIHAEERNHWEEHVRREEIVRTVEAQFQRRDGEIIWVELNARVIRNANNEVLCYEGTLEDITERKQAEMKLQSAHQRAEFLVDLMAHDLNNINQGIMLTLELIESDEELPRHVHEGLQASLDQVERSAELISNVKRFQSLESEPRQLSTRDLSPPFHAAVRAVERAFPNKQVFLSTNIQDQKYWVHGDGFLTELFFNLLHNAVKMDRTSLVKIEVKASDGERDGFVKVEIQDCGPGVPDSEKNRIFNRFPDGMEGVRGSGIGLTLVQRILNRYGGQIWVEDRVTGNHSQGANFVVLIPKGER
jgi:PAS domain S-box-containing protein